MKSYKNLKDLREKFAGVRLPSVAAKAHLPVARLQQIEGGDEPDIHELEALARVYGVDAESLFERPICLPAEDAAEALTSFDEFQELGDPSRLAALDVACAAKDLARLASSTWEHLPKLTLSPKTSPHERGADYAEQLRREWRLGQGPILSMRDLVQTRSPDIRLLYARLGPTGPSALSFTDSFRGPLIVLNLQGKNENPCVRRFSLAHELCHVLVDRLQGNLLASISGYLSDTHLEREQQANAFATRLLCPEQAARKAVAKYREQDAASMLLRDYGLHYRATQLYLRNLANIDLPSPPPEDLAALPLSEKWELAESPSGLSGFPLAQVPPERRTALAYAAATAYAQGAIPRDRFAELLSVTPAEELERVLDHFDLENPLSGA